MNPALGKFSCNCKQKFKRIFLLLCVALLFRAFHLSNLRTTKPTSEHRPDVHRILRRRQPVAWLAVEDNKMWHNGICHGSAGVAGWQVQSKMPSGCCRMT